MKKRIPALIIMCALVAFAAVGCGSADVVAKVNGERIMRGDLDKKIAEIKSGLESQGMNFEGEENKDSLGKVEQEALDELVDETLLMQEAQKQNIAVSDEDVEKQVQGLKSSFGEDTFNALLKQQKLTEADLKHELKIQMTANAVFDKVTDGVTVDKSEEQTYFDANKDSLVQLKVAHILVAVPAGASSDVDQAAKTKAEGIIKQLQAGADFAELAKQDSDDQQSGQNGGVLDLYFTRDDPSLVQEFVDGAFKLDEGQFSPEPVRSAYGYHIIKVLDKKDTFDELESSINDQLLSQKKNQMFMDYFDGIRQKATIQKMFEE